MFPCFHADSQPSLCVTSSLQGYCDFLPEERLLQAVEVGQVVTSSMYVVYLVAQVIAFYYLKYNAMFQLFWPCCPCRMHEFANNFYL